MRNYLSIIACALLAMTACKNQKHLSKSMPEPLPTAVEVPAPVETTVPTPRAPLASAPKSTNALIQDYMQDLASAPTALAASRSEAELLSLFASKSTPVLIVIYQEGNFKDYDEPTTISAYLEYLRLQSKQPASVQNIVKAAQGKIIELELYQAD